MDLRRVILGASLLLIPATGSAAPIDIAASRAVGPLRTDIGDGLCATVVHLSQNPSFHTVAAALDKLNLTPGMGMVVQKISKKFRHARFRNSEVTAIGDFPNESTERLPYESNLAARVRGYLNVSPVDTIYTNAVYASAGARLRIGGETLVEFDSDETVRKARQVRYAKAGLYPVELIYYANGGIVVLEASAAPSPEQEGDLLGLDTTKFRIIPTAQLFSARVGQSVDCKECSLDNECTPSTYCARDWPSSDPGPNGTCQPCLVNDHCGETCMPCTGSTPICVKGACKQCLEDADCKNGGACDKATGTCKDPPSCMKDAECPMGQKCSQVTGVCSPICSNDAHCLAGQKCNQATGTCESGLNRYVGGCSATPAPPNGSAAGLIGLAGFLALVPVLRRRRAAALAALFFFSLLAGEARAQISANVQNFRPAIGPENIITTEGTRTPGHLRPILSGLLEYGRLPLRYVSPSGDTLAETVPHLLALHLQLGLGLTRYLSLAVDLPVLLYQGFDARTPSSDVATAPGPVGVGDLRFVGKVRFLKNEHGGFGLAFVPQVTFPTGKGLDLRGDDAFGIEPRVAADYRTRGGSIIALNVGFLGRTSDQEVSGQRVTHQFRYGLGGLLALPRGFGLLLDLSGAVSVSSIQGGQIYAPTELHGGLRWVHRNGLNVMGGLGGGFTEAVGSPQVRLFLSLGWLPTRWHKTQKPRQQVLLSVNKSGDGAGVVRTVQKGIDCGIHCSAEFPAGSEVTLVALPDPDSEFSSWSGPCSGIGPCVLSLREATRVGVEFSRKVEKAQVTVEKTGDGTGVVVSEPAGIDCGKLCQAAFRLGKDMTLKAVPDADSWFAGWEGPCSGTESCTTAVAGPVTVKARFMKHLLEVKEDKIDLKGNSIHFETGKAAIQADSYHLLDEIVSFLKLKAEIRLKIEGHTDTRRYRGKGGNVKLSQDRAKSVVDYLVSHGVAAERLSSFGYGETCPVATNKTEAGMAQNRRTEFWILKPGELPEKICRARRKAPPASPAMDGKGEKGERKMPQKPKGKMPQKPEGKMPEQKPDDKPRLMR